MARTKVCVSAPPHSPPTLVASVRSGEPAEHLTAELQATRRRLLGGQPSWDHGPWSGPGAVSLTPPSHPLPRRLSSLPVPATPLFLSLFPHLPLGQRNRKGFLTPRGGWHLTFAGRSELRLSKSPGVGGWGTAHSCLEGGVTGTPLCGPSVQTGASFPRVEVLRCCAYHCSIVPREGPFSNLCPELLA